MESCLCCCGPLSPRQRTDSGKVSGIWAISCLRTEAEAVGSPLVSAAVSHTERKGGLRTKELELDFPLGLLSSRRVRRRSTLVSFARNISVVDQRHFRGQVSVKRILIWCAAFASGKTSTFLMPALPFFCNFSFPSIVYLFWDALERKYLHFWKRTCSMLEITIARMFLSLGLRSCVKLHSNLLVIHFL